MVTGSGFGESRVPQNLGSGQRLEDHGTILELQPKPELWAGKMGSDPRAAGWATLIALDLGTGLGLEDGHSSMNRPRIACAARDGSESPAGISSADRPEWGPWEMKILG